MSERLERAEGVRQCLMIRGYVHKTAWIPERFATKGAYLRLFDEDGWRVETVGIWLPHVAQHHGYFAGGIFHQ